MYADLVLAASLELELDERVAAVVATCVPRSARPLAAVVSVTADDLEPVGVAQPALDGSLGFIEDALEHGDVSAVLDPSVPVADEDLLHFDALGVEHDA